MYNKLGTFDAVRKLINPDEGGRWKVEFCIINDPLESNNKSLVITHFKCLLCLTVRLLRNGKDVFNLSVFFIKNSE